jgi:hypothetical protein
MNALVVNDLGKKEIIGDMLNQLAVEDILTPDFCQLSLKDRKRRPEGGFLNGSRKFLSKIFGRCPKITGKHKHEPKLKYSSQLVTRVSREILWNGRKLTQQTKHKTELERPANARNGKSEPPKTNEKSEKNKRRTGQNFYTAQILNSSLRLSVFVLLDQTERKC